MSVVDICIPKHYHIGMTKQIAVRLPDELVEFLDRLVAEGRFDSRAAIVTRELKRLKRRIEAEQDAEIYRREGDDPDLLEFVRYTSRLPMDID
jgi:Arc/MetJ-type ribon-helix-helix transcriptional regulator